MKREEYCLFCRCETDQVLIPDPTFEGQYVWQCTECEELFETEDKPDDELS